jgi:drug/metabolite transporter (DMT)-like permease
MSREKLKGHVAMITANMAWGLMSPISKMVMTTSVVSAWALVSFRVGGAAIAFWIASLFVEREKVATRDLFLMAVASLFGIIFNQGVFILGVSYTSPINASIVTTTLPIITMVIAAFYLKEPITWTKFIGILIGGSGALILILSSHRVTGANMQDNTGLLGILLCLLAQFCYAIYFVMFKKLIFKYSPITLMKWMFLFGTLVYIPFNFNQLHQINYTQVPLNIFYGIGFVILGGTFFSYMMIPVGQKYLRPTVATMYNNVQPIVASFAAVLWWHLDTFSYVKAFAIILVFIGVYVVTKSKAKDSD